MSETRSTKYNQFTTSMKRQKMTRNQPDQRKGSMEGNWATTAAIPDGRRGHSACKRTGYSAGVVMGASPHLRAAIVGQWLMIAL